MAHNPQGDGAVDTKGSHERERTADKAEQKAKRKGIVEHATTTPVEVSPAKAAPAAPAIVDLDAHTSPKVDKRSRPKATAASRATGSSGRGTGKKAKSADDVSVAMTLGSRSSAVLSQASSILVMIDTQASWKQWASNDGVRMPFAKDIDDLKAECSSPLVQQTIASDARTLRESAKDDANFQKQLRELPDTLEDKVKAVESSVKRLRAMHKAHQES